MLLVQLNMANSPYRVAIVGTGGISRSHATACSLTDRAELAAVCDVSQEALNRFFERFPVDASYLELDRMLAKEDIDIAVIATWGVQHAKVGQTIAESRSVKAILCEKPFTQTESEAIRLVEAVRKNGVLIAEAFKFRHHPLHLKLKELIDDGGIGKPLTVRSTFCTSSGAPAGSRTPETTWKLNKAKGGGSIFDLACYNIHHARWIFGAEPVEVFARERPGIEVDNGANIQLNFAEGGVAQITVGFDSWRSQEVEIHCTSGSLKTDRAWNNENLPVWLDRNLKEMTERRHFGPVYQFTLQLEHMCDVLDGTAAHRIPPENSIAQMRVIDAVYESMKTHQAVTLD